MDQLSHSILKVRSAAVQPGGLVKSLVERVGSKGSKERYRVPASSCCVNKGNRDQRHMEKVLSPTPCLRSDFVVKNKREAQVELLGLFLHSYTLFQSEINDPYCKNASHFVGEVLTYR